MAGIVSALVSGMTTQDIIEIQDMMKETSNKDLKIVFEIIKRDLEPPCPERELVVRMFLAEFKQRGI